MAKTDSQRKNVFAEFDLSVVVNSKSAIPWIHLLIVLAAAGFLFVNSQNKESEFVRLCSENSELPAV